MPVLSKVPIDLGTIEGNVSDKFRAIRDRVGKDSGLFELFVPAEQVALFRQLESPRVTVSVVGTQQSASQSQPRATNQWTHIRSFAS